MRSFIVLGHAAPTTPDFSLDDLAGGAGRLDVLCRCVNAAFFLSHAIREDTRVYLVLRDELTIRLEGAELRYLSPDERNIAARLRTAIEAARDAVGHQEVTSSPGIAVSKRGLGDLLAAIDAEWRLLQLHEAGRPITDLDPPPDPAFVLADHRDFQADAVDRLRDADATRVRVGPRALHADHAITIAHNYLDTDAYTAY